MIFQLQTMKIIQEEETRQHSSVQAKEWNSMNASRKLVIGLTVVAIESEWSTSAEMIKISLSI